LLVERLVLRADTIRPAARQIVEGGRAPADLLRAEHAFDRQVALLAEPLEVGRLEARAVLRQHPGPCRRLGPVERLTDVLGLLGRGHVVGEPVVDLHDPFSLPMRSGPKRARTAAKAASVRSRASVTSASVCAADRNQLCQGWSQTPRRAASPVKRFARSNVPAATSALKVRNGSWTGPLWVMRSRWARARWPRPSRSSVPARVIRSIPRSVSSASSVASAAAMGTAANQKDPVTKTCWAASRRESRPMTAARA